MFNFIINGRRWRFKWEYLPHFIKDGVRHKHYGQCDPPDTKNKTITINTALTEFEELDAIIHEIRHAENWDLYEEGYVDARSTELAKILWKIGYRRVNRKDN